MDDEAIGGIEHAVRAVGSQRELARRLGVTQQAISEWVASGEIPPRRVLDVERASGVPRRVLAPHLYAGCSNCGA